MSIKWYIIYHIYIWYIKLLQGSDTRHKPDHETSIKQHRTFLSTDIRVTIICYYFSECTVYSNIYTWWSKMSEKNSDTNRTPWPDSSSFVSVKTWPCLGWSNHKLFLFKFLRYQRAHMQSHSFIESSFWDVPPMATHTQCRWVWLLQTWQQQHFFFVQDNNFALISNAMVLFAASKMGPLLTRTCRRL